MITIDITIHCNHQPLRPCQLFDPDQAGNCVWCQQTECVHPDVTHELYETVFKLRGTV